ncbi:glycosyl transferase family 2 [Paenibacillus elgii]|uniref:Glycosyl transferase family 2 n=1 Tax=Paenibacillus elgii TaxID=189691 RepID=A0A2T6FWN7_9BACL|nr:methyltransferase domain-containing protein [Paenibacillus elgii]PUA36320.1 glycosyl transferase family 2 [Paenibacillus elgii]
MVDHLKHQGPYYCPYCNNTIVRFRPWPDIYDFPKCQYEMWNKQTAMCPVCSSFDRERLYKFYIERETDLLVRPQKLLHIAPEKNLRKWLKGQPNLSYICGDLMPQDAEMERVDLTAMPYADETFDAVICSHVLEHIPEDHKAMTEICRVLNPDGWSILQVPIALNFEEILEDPAVTTPQARKEHFGQDDHVRIYNRKGFVGRLEAAGFHVDLFNLAEKYGVEEANLYGLSEKDTLYIGTKKTVPAQ